MIKGFTNILLALGLAGLWLSRDIHVNDIKIIEFSIESLINTMINNSTCIPFIHELNWFKKNRIL